MNAVSEIAATAASVPVGSTPGGLLRQQREQRGLTVQQVSEELLLDAWLVEALEENRFRALGAPVYAKGHLRKYALLLGLSPELILSRYQVIAEPTASLPQAPRSQPPLTPAAAKPSIDWSWFHNNLPHTDWRTYAIIGGFLLAGSSTWLLVRQLRIDQDSSQVAIATPAPAVVAPAPQPAGQVDVTHDTLTPPATAGTQSRPASPPLLAGAEALPGPLASVQRPLESAVAPKPMALPAMTPPTAGVTAPNPEIPQVSLRLEFAVASWAEVYDGDGKRLLYAVGDPSRARTVSGKPPLKVTLGMAGSVQARVNGRPIAIPRRIGQDAASFSIGANGRIR